MKIKSVINGNEDDYQPPSIVTRTDARLTLGESAAVCDLRVMPVVFDGSRILVQIEGPESAMQDAELRRALGAEIERAHFTVAQGRGRFYAEYWIPFLTPKNGSQVKPHIKIGTLP